MGHRLLNLDHIAFRIPAVKRFELTHMVISGDRHEAAANRALQIAKLE